MGMGKPTPRDERLMDILIAEANRVIDEGKVGVAALLAWGDEVLSIGHNTYEETRDMTAHGEMVVFRETARRLDAMNEEDRAQVTLYSTLEPCLMCFSATSSLNIKRAVYAALVEDADEQSLIARGLTCDDVNARLVKGEMELVEGVRREEGRKILARMGHLAEQQSETAEKS